MNQYQNITSGLAILKNYYQGPLRSQFNDDLAVWRAAQKGTHSWAGKQVVRPWKVRRNQGVGATSDGGNLPNIGRQTTVECTISARFNYLRFGLTGPMIKASQRDVGAFVKDASFELEEGYKDLRKDVNRQLTWDGTGDLARVNTALVGATTLVVKGREDTEPALKFLDVDLSFDVYTAAGALVSSGHTITAIQSGDASTATATLTISPALTASAGDVLVRANSFGMEIQGALTQLDGGTSTVFGVDRSLYPATQGNVIDMSALSSTQLSLDKMQQADDEAERRGGPVDVLWTDHATRRMYQKLLSPDKRHNNTIKGDGGFSNKGENYLEFNGKPLVADQDCPTRLFYLKAENLVKYVLCDMEFADESGSMWIPNSDKDAVECRIRFFANLFNENPAGSSCLKSYTSP